MAIAGSMVVSAFRIRLPFSSENNGIHLRALSNRPPLCIRLFSSTGNMKTPIAAISRGTTPSESLSSGTCSSPSKSMLEKEVKNETHEMEEVEIEMPWIREKALDMVEFTGSVVQAIPGPRVGNTSFPWILAVASAYATLTFIIAFTKTVRKLTSPRWKRRLLVRRNANLCKSIDMELEKGELGEESLKGVVGKSGFSMVEVMRKYIRYTLSEKPFTPLTVTNLIHFRKVSLLDDASVAEVLNEISRRIVSDKGPVVKKIDGYTERGFQRKLAVQSLFGKVFYLSELPEFCTMGTMVKDIFGVSDEDVDNLRISTFSESSDMDSLHMMVEKVEPDDSIEA